jgi:hypothetical protein
LEGSEEGGRELKEEGEDDGGQENTTCINESSD